MKKTYKKLNLLLITSFVVTLAASCAPKFSSVSLNSNGKFNEPVTETPASPGVTKPSVPLYTKQIKDLAAKSVCTQINWESRGRSPAGYIKGMSLAYARSLCRIKATNKKPAAVLLAASNSGNTAKDVLAHYQDVMDRLGLVTRSAGESPLHATYLIGIGLGMKESSGRHCVGWDEAAGANRASNEAEAGLFQASFNSMRASPELKKLYEEYLANPTRCHLETFKEGASCKSQTLLGTGDGAKFQDFVKKCPAFATEYAMSLIRILRSHFGPLNRKTAQVAPACELHLSTIRQIVNQDPEGVCKELF